MADAVKIEAKRERDRQRLRRHYAENVDEIRKRKNRLYAEDPIYRQKQQAYARETPRRRRVKASLERAPLPKPTGPQTRWKTETVEIDGVTRQLFTIGALARVLGKAISTLRVWEKNGVLPATPYRTDKGDRLYSYDLVTSIRKEMIEKGRIDPYSNNKRTCGRNGIPRTVRYPDGTEVNLELYKGTVLAEALRKKPSTVSGLEARGYIPKTPLLAASTRYRLYTADMISAVKAALDQVGYPALPLGKLRPDITFNKIADAWRNQGILDAQLVAEPADSKPRRWSPEEYTRLAELSASKVSVEEMATVLGRRVMSIYVKLGQLGLSTNETGVERARKSRRKRKRKRAAARKRKSRKKAAA